MKKQQKIDFWQKVFSESKILVVNMPDLSKIDGTNFRKLRNELNLTQNKFADILGVTKKAIEKWEQGANPITGPLLRLVYLIENDHSLLDRLYHEHRPQTQQSPTWEFFSNYYNNEMDNLFSKFVAHIHRHSSIREVIEEEEFSICIKQQQDWSQSPCQN